MNSKRWPFLCLLLVYSLALVRPLWPLVDYGLQQDYYAQVLCYNKAKPELKCKGQCVLMKRLLAEVDKKRPQPFTPSNVQAGEESPQDVCVLGEWRVLKMEVLFPAPQSDRSFWAQASVPPSPPPEHHG